MSKKFLFAVTIFSTFFAFESKAVGVNVPSSAEPSRIGTELSTEKPQPKAAAPLLIKDERDQASISPEQARVEFKLQSVKLEGNTVFPDEELKSIYANDLGKNITVGELYGIRDAITKKYREAGYIISRAVIPQQKFEKGGANVTIRIVEGFISSVSVTGKTKANQRIIDAYVDKIKQAGPLNSKTLERYLLLMNDLAGTKATAVLKPSAAQVGGSDVIINLDHKNVDALITVDNSGTKYIGPGLASGEVDLNSVLGLSEQITFRGITDTSLKDKELRFFEAGWKQPIGTEGTYARVRAGKTFTHPGATLESLNIEGDSEVYDAEVVHPFIRSRKENLSGRIGYVIKDTDTDASGLQLYDDKVREAVLGGTFDYADTAGGINLIDVSVTQGMDFMGATDGNDPKSRTNGDAVFTRYNFEASRNQRITDRLSLLVAGAGQYADEGLLASEEFGIGGREFGRGYDFSEITGDAGIAGKVELQYGLPVNVSYLSNIQLYTFYDLGRIWQKEQFVSGEQGQDSLASAGAGLRFNITKDITGYTELAKPLTKNIQAEGDKELQFNFGISLVY